MLCEIDGHEELKKHDKASKQASNVLKMDW